MIVGTLILIVAVGAFMLQRAMRQQYLEAHRYTFGEVALNLAESGLNVSMEHLHESALSPGTPFYQALVESAFDSVEGTSLDLPSEHLDDLVELFDGDASLEVKVELRSFEPFYPASGLRGVERDPREKFGEMALVSKATYRGVTRSILASKQVKVIDVTVPVLSKFTLFVGRRGGDPNILEYDRTSPADGFRLGSSPARPLTIYNNEDPLPIIEYGTQFLPMGDLFGTSPPDLHGLVYLGGNDGWYLNLAHGIGAAPWEELFLLRRTRYRMDSELDGIRYEYGLTFGFYDGILRSAKFGSNADPGGGFRYPGNNERVRDRTSALHLFGDVENMTPTVVLGSAFRSYVTLRLLDGLWYPYRDLGEFGSVGGGPPFGGSYEAYEQVMARVVHEPYNRSWDYIATNTEQLEDDGRVKAAGTPFVPEAKLVEGSLERIGPAVDGDEHFLYPTPGEASPGLMRLERAVGEDREVLFRGALEDLDGSLLESILTAKATYAVADQAEFYDRYLKDGVLKVPGIVHIRRGDLDIGGVQVADGCMVLVQGNVNVQGGLGFQDPTQGHTLSLVSLEGGVRVSTSETVNAHLVCLSGQFTAQSAVDIQGAVAADTLDFERLVVGSSAKKITYEGDLDPTDEAAYRKHLRVFMDKRVHLSVQGF